VYDPGAVLNQVSNHIVLIVVLGVTGPRELIYGERESFIGAYRWQRSGLGVSTLGLTAGGGGT
jgi:hypothetical protein